MPQARLTGWIRPVAALFAMAGALALSACGGGSGSVNNPNTPTTPTPIPTLQTLPAGAVVAYSGVPTTIQIVGGTPPYTALSNNSAVLPVPFNVSGDTLVLVANPVAVGNDVPVAITVSDQSGQSVIANVIVRFAPLFQNSLVVTPSNANCGGQNVCDGDTATVVAVATGVGGAPLPGRQIRFDAVFGPFSIMTSNPAVPLSPTLTVVTDSTGTAAVQIQTTANAPTQSAQIRATDVTTGQALIANFIVQRSTGSNTLAVIPNTATITTLYNDSCSTGFLVDYYIFGGTPPYTVTASFPTAVLIVPTVVATSGGFFRATTNGTCVNPLTFAIVDAAGKTTTATLNNTPGSLTRPGTPTPTPPTLAVTPTTVSSNACAGKTFNFVITGGTAPYNVSVSPGGAIVTPPVVTTSGGNVGISGLANGSGITTVIILDSGLGAQQQTKTATISCS
jgi:hypothetical protein